MKEFLDNRNIELWNKISENYKIDFQKSPNISYGCYSKGKSVTFYIGNGTPSIDSFTHEMLHIYFRLNDCFLGGGLSNILLCNNRLGKILSSNLIDHISNCFEHIKMLPIYIEMGFERSKFLTDYFDHKCEPQELIFFQQNYIKGGNINIESVDLFIGKLFAMLADPNDKFDYKNELKEFKKLDSELYSAVESAINMWKSIDVENKDITATNYHDLIFAFEEDLEKWYENKFSNPS